MTDDAHKAGFDVYRMNAKTAIESVCSSCDQTVAWDIQLIISVFQHTSGEIMIEWGIKDPIHKKEYTPELVLGVGIPRYSES